MKTKIKTFGHWLLVKLTAPEAVAMEKRVARKLLAKVVASGGVGATVASLLIELHIV